MQIFLDEVAARYSDNRMIMILEGAGWHRREDMGVVDNDVKDVPQGQKKLDMLFG